MATTDSYLHALVLAAHNFQESSRMVEVFSRERGRLTLVCRGARRNKSPLLNLTEPYTEVLINVVEGRSSFYLKDGEVIDAHLGLRKSIRRMSIAAFSTELLMAVLFEGTDQELYEFYKTFLEVTSEAPDEAATRLIGAYLLKLSSLIGFRPSLGRCLICSRPIEAPYVFDLQGGGMVCSEHESAGIRIEAELYRELQNYILKSFSELAKEAVEGEQEIQKKAAKLALRYFRIHTGRNSLKCLNILQSLKLL